MCDRRAILDVLQSHTKLLSEFLPAHVEECVGTVRSPVHFLRHHVAQSTPLVVRADADVARWPALARWSDQGYLSEALRDARVTVALTPDGLADAPASDESALMLPAEATMAYPDFIDMLRRQNSTDGENSPVVYLQKQNNSFITEFSALAADVGRVGWADVAFGAANIDAINFWQGARPTKTSWHRDPYENIYVVIRGSKRVRLLPMTDAWRMRIKTYPQAKWEYKDGEFTAQPIAGEPVRWSSLRPCTCTGYPLKCPSCVHLDGHPPPKEVLLHAGDVLYIPAWVYHEISHDETPNDTSCIAINFWYEAQYGQHGFSTIQTFDQLAQLCTPSTNT